MTLKYGYAWAHLSEIYCGAQVLGRLGSVGTDQLAERCYSRGCVGAFPEELMLLNCGAGEDS